MHVGHVVGTLARGTPAVGYVVVIGNVRRERRRDGKMEACIVFESKKVSGVPGV